MAVILSKCLDSAISIYIVSQKNCTLGKPDNGALKCVLSFKFFK